MQRFSERFEAHRQQQQAEVRKIPLTNASRGHASTARKSAMQVDESRELFKLSKLSRSSPRVDSNVRKPVRKEFEDFNAPVYEPPAALDTEDALEPHHPVHPIPEQQRPTSVSASGSGRLSSAVSKGAAEDMLLERLAV
jgi:hypothetical protein